MSHVVASKVYCTNLADAKTAGESLGFELCEGATHYAWYESWQDDFHGATAAVSNGYEPKQLGTCEHKLRRVDHRAGMYEIGLCQRPDGKPGWELVYDNWGGGGRAVEEKAGKGLTKFKAALAEAALSRQLVQLGARVQRTVEAGGVRLRAISR
jgi:hypothetical protein